MSDSILLLNKISQSLQPDKKNEDINKLISKIGLLHPIPFFLERVNRDDLWQEFLKSEKISEKIDYPFANSQLPILYTDEDVRKRIPNYDDLLVQIRQALEKSNINYFNVQKGSILKENIYSINAGSGVLLATYKGSKVYLLFPNFDVVHQIIANNEQMLQSESSGVPPGLNNIDSNSILSIAQTLAFALPPPWGPVVAAGLMFAKFLFGKSGQSQMQVLLSKMFDAIKKVIENEDDLTLINNISAFSQAFDVKLNVMSDDPDNVDFMLSDVVPLLKNALDPSFEGSVYSSFEQILKKGYFIPKNGNDKLGFSTYQLLASTVMTISLMHKILLQIYSLASSKYYKDKDQEKFNTYTNLWLGTFENWHVLVNGGDSPRVAGLLEILSQTRSQVISSRTNAIKIIATPPNPQRYQLHTNYTYNDAWVGTSGNLGSCTIQDSSCNKKMDKKTTGFKNSLVSNFVASLDRLVDVNAIVEKTEFALKMWMNYISPVAPKVNTTTVDFEKSNTSTPRGKWVNGAFVRYAFRFKNTAGEVLSPWTDYVKITDKAFPTLENIPIDQHQLAQVRWVVRQFKGEQEKDIAVIRNNTITTWVDNVEK